MRYAESGVVAALAMVALVRTVHCRERVSGGFGATTTTTTAFVIPARKPCPPNHQSRLPPHPQHTSSFLRYQQRPHPEEESGGTFHPHHHWAQNTNNNPPHNQRHHRRQHHASSSFQTHPHQNHHHTTDDDATQNVDASVFDIDAETTMEDLARQWDELQQHHHHNNPHLHAADPLIKPWHPPSDPHARLPRAPTAGGNNPNLWAHYMTTSDVQWVTDPQDLQVRLDHTKPVQPPPPSADDLASVAAHLQQAMHDVTPAAPHTFDTYMAVVDGSSTSTMNSGTVIDIDAHSHCGHLPGGGPPSSPLPTLTDMDAALLPGLPSDDYPNELLQDVEFSADDNDEEYQDTRIHLPEINQFVEPPLSQQQQPHDVSESDEPTMAELTEALTAMTQDEMDPNHYYGIPHPPPDEEILMRYDDKEEDETGAPDGFVGQNMNEEEDNDDDENHGTPSVYAPPYWVVDTHDNLPPEAVSPAPPFVDWNDETLPDTLYESSPPPSSHGYQVHVTTAASRPAAPVSPEPQPPLTNGFAEPQRSCTEPYEPPLATTAAASNDFTYQHTRPPAAETVEPIFASSEFLHSPPPPPPPEPIDEPPPSNDFVYRSSRPPAIVEPPPPPPSPSDHGFAHEVSATPHGSHTPHTVEDPLSSEPDISPTQILGPTMEELAQAWARMTRDHVNEPPTMEDLAQAWAQLKLEKEHASATAATDSSSSSRNTVNPHQAVPSRRHPQPEEFVPPMPTTTATPPPSIELQDLADLWTERNREKNIYVGSTSYLDTKDNDSKQVYFSSPPVQHNGHPSMSTTWNENHAPRYEYNTEEPIPQPNPWSSDTPSHTNRYQYTTGHQQPPPPWPPRELQDLIASWAARSPQQQQAHHHQTPPHHHQVMDADRIGRRRGSYRDIDGLAPDKQM